MSSYKIIGNKNDSSSNYEIIGVEPGTGSGYLVLTGVVVNPNAPTVSLVSPNLGSSAGGWNISITGTKFISGATVSINGVACTSVVVNSTTNITCTTPAFSTTNGSSTAQAVAITTSNGTASSALYYYLPSNNPIEYMHRADGPVVLVGSGVASWRDVSSNSNHWTQSNTGNAPAAPAGNFAGTGLPFIAFNGSSSFMTQTLSPTLSTKANIFLVAANTSQVNNIQVFGNHGGGAATSLYLQYQNTPSPAWNVGNGAVAYPSTATIDTSPHVFAAIMGTTDYSILVDGITTVGGAVGSISAGDCLLGSYNSSLFFSSLNILGDLMISGVLSSGDLATIMSILKKTSGTP